MRSSESEAEGFLRMLGLIQRVHELKNQSAVPSGLQTTRFVPLPYALVFEWLKTPVVSLFFPGNLELLLLRKTRIYSISFFHCWVVQKVALLIFCCINNHPQMHASFIVIAKSDKKEQNQKRLLCSCSSRAFSLVFSFWFHQLLLSCHCTMSCLASVKWCTISFLVSYQFRDALCFQVGVRWKVLGELNILVRENFVSRPILLARSGVRKYLEDALCGLLTARDKSHCVEPSTYMLN